MTDQALLQLPEATMPAYRHTARRRLLRQLRRAIPMLWLLPLLLILGIFTFAPLAWILHSSLATEQGWSLSRFHELLTSAFYRQAFGNSLYLSFGSSGACLLQATLGACSLCRSGGLPFRTFPAGRSG